MARNKAEDSTAKQNSGRVRQSRFPTSLFFICLGVILLAVGINSGLIIAMEAASVSSILEVHVIIFYWLLVTFLLVLYIRRMVRKVYEEPMKRISETTKKVAAGDFTARVEPIDKRGERDYLDVMIDDLNVMIAELGSIETLKTDFFSNVSHEIKTPLAVMQNAAELLQRGKLDEDQREQVDMICRQSKRLNRLITDILRLNKLEKQVIAPKGADYDLCAQLAESAILLEELWEARGIELDVDIEDSCTICADEDLMALVWNNLLSNAIKFTETGGTIRIAQRSDAEKIRVLISDSGCGMDEATRRHIFDKFYQGDTSHSSEGNGLGLALVYRILQIHGFSIEVKSAPGEGSTFVVTIPKTTLQV